MKLLVILLAALFLAGALIADSPQTGTHAQAGDVAHGAADAAAEEVHGEGADHEEESYFGIPGWILKALNMIFFIGLLVWLLKGPVGNAFAARSAEIRGAAEQARERREKADRLAADIQARLAQIEAEVVAIRQRAESEGERQRRELIAAAEAEAAKILQAARNEVDNRLKLARKELTEFAGELAATRAEEILREKITPEDQRKLFRESLTQVGEA
ncbi:MAG TPA: ATP synthase F0 subunit B [Thermoanaerobaculia bacterium]|nr:ATP synthase F0 subunit B [Thermoanaerobaculia bacterium]